MGYKDALRARPLPMGVDRLPSEYLNWEFQGPWSHYCINCNMCIIHRRSVPRISDRTLANRPGERLYMDVVKFQTKEKGSTDQGC